MAVHRTRVIRVIATIVVAALDLLLLGAALVFFVLLLLATLSTRAADYRHDVGLTDSLALVACLTLLGMGTYVLVRMMHLRWPFRADAESPFARRGPTGPQTS
jgi:hypothetical protein